MKNYKGVLISLMLSVLSLPAMATDTNPGAQCVDQQFISYIDFGYITNVVGGPDYGNSVVVHFANGVSLPLNLFYNNNDHGGRNLIEGLRMAYMTRSKVSVWDHHWNNCDDFDMIRVYPATF